MNRKILLLISLLLMTAALTTKVRASGPFRWGNATYVSLALKEPLSFEGSEVELLAMKNHYNRIRVDHDTAWIGVCFRSPAVILGNLRVFVADNKNVAALSSRKENHGLLEKDVLVALSPAAGPLIETWDFAFPVSFTGGYLWRNNEDTYMFSYMGASVESTGNDYFHPGVAIDMPNARGLEKYAILAMEAGKVVWVENRIPGTEEPKAAVCIESASSSGIYYIYRNLYNRNLMVSRNQQVQKGDPLGTIWGDGNQENLHLTVVRSDSLPTLKNAEANIVNFFPQLLELYYGRQPLNSQLFTKGQILFGRAAGPQGNVKNASAFEEYQGTGWLLGNWNTTGKVEWVSSRQNGNVRLSRLLFHGKAAECVNPNPWYEYQISVQNGVYRIRASVGDGLLPSWQKIEYEGVTAGTFSLGKGEYTWTPEKIVRIRDNKLNIRIYLNDTGSVAGISEIVFQQASR